MKHGNRQWTYLGVPRMSRGKDQILVNGVKRHVKYEVQSTAQTFKAKASLPTRRFEILHRGSRPPTHYAHWEPPNPLLKFHFSQFSRRSAHCGPLHLALPQVRSIANSTLLIPHGCQNERENIMNRSNILMDCCLCRFRVFPASTSNSCPNNHVCQGPLQTRKDTIQSRP